MMDGKRRQRLTTMMAAVMGAGDYEYYLLRDDFTDTVAAGSVNGTLATPGGLGTEAQRTRTVTDTNSKLSLAAGEAVIATGGNGQSDPALWWGLQTRLAGRTQLFRVNSNSGGGNALDMGWDGDQTTFALDYINFAESGVLKVSPNGGTNTWVGLFTDGIWYDLAFMMRSAGTLIFIKGGTQYTHWQLLYPTLVGAGSRYPTVQATSIVSVFRAAFGRCADLTMFAPLAYDAFGRADGAIGSSETSGPDAQTTPARAWSGATWTISTNKAINTPAHVGDVVVNGTFAADTNWTKGTGWTIAAGVANAAAAGGYLTATVEPLSLNTWYRITLTVSGWIANSVSPTLGTHAALNGCGADGSFIRTGLCIGSTALRFLGNTAFSGNIDNVVCEPLTTADLFCTFDVGVADVVGEVNVTIPAGVGLNAGLIFNLDSDTNPQNFVLVQMRGNNVTIYECVAGAYTIIQSTAVTYSAGATFKGFRKGTSVWAYYNNLIVGAIQTVTANINTRHGMFKTDPTASLDIFNLWALGSNGEYSVLSRFTNEG